MADVKQDSNQTQNKNQAFDVDVILEHIGDFGKFQYRYWFCTLYAVLFPNSAILIYNFTGYIPKYRCFIPGCDNETNPEYGADCFNGSIPYSNSKKAYDQCYRYNYSVPEGSDSQNIPTVQCDRFVFDKSLFMSTVPSQYELTCENEWKVTFVSSLTMAGILVGAFLLGPLADIIGRRKTYLILSIWLGGFAVGSSFAPDFTSFAALRFLTGMGGVALLQTNAIWGIEAMSPRLRVRYMFSLNLSSVTGSILTGIVAYFIREWRYVHLVVFVPMSLLVVFFFFLPESARWLIAKKRYEEARVVLEQAAKLNGKTIPPHLLVIPADNAMNNNDKTAEMDTKEHRSGTILDIIKTGCLLKRLLILFFCWASAMLCYYGLSMASANLSSDIFLSYELSMVVEIPAYLIGMYVLERLGRRLILNIALITGGTLCLIAGLVPRELFTLTIVCSLIGKFFVAMENVSVNTISTELFPTATRGVTIALCSTMGKVGGILAPIMASLGKTNRSLPYLIFGIINLIAGILTLFLPETKGTAIPATIEQAKDLEKHTLHCLKCGRHHDSETSSDDLTKL